MNVLVVAWIAFAFAVLSFAFVAAITVIMVVLIRRLAPQLKPILSLLK